VSYTDVRSDKKARILNFPKNLKRLCKKVKGGVSTVSRISGIPRASIYAIQAGTITCIPEWQLRGLEEALGVDFGIVINYDSDLIQEHDGSFQRIDLVHKETPGTYKSDR